MHLLLLYYLFIIALRLKKEYNEIRKVGCDMSFIEDSRNEFKLVLNDKLEKEIVGFLNANGGNVYIGVDDAGNVVGLDGNIDEIQLQIKDRIKNNILPATLGLFDIEVMEDDDKKYFPVISNVYAICERTNIDDLDNEALRPSWQRLSGSMESDK